MPGPLAAHKTLGALTAHKTLGALTAHKTLGALAANKTLGALPAHKTLGALAADPPTLLSLGLHQPPPSRSFVLPPRPPSRRPCGVARHQSLACHILFRILSLPPPTHSLAISANSYRLAHHHIDQHTAHAPSTTRSRRLNRHLALSRDLAGQALCLSGATLTGIRPTRTEVALLVLRPPQTAASPAASRIRPRFGPFSTPHDSTRATSSSD